MSVKRPALSVYDILETADGGRLLVGVVTDTQWEVICREFGAQDLRNDPRLKTNGQRVMAREWLLPALAALIRKFDQKSLAAKLEQIGLPFAPISKPWDPLDAPHLNANDGLAPTWAGGKTIHVPALPLEVDGKRIPKRADPPAVGEHSVEFLRGLGCSPQEIASLVERGVVAFPADPRSEEKSGPVDSTE